MDLETTAKDLCDASELGKAEDFASGDISDVTATVEGQQVMLALRVRVRARVKGNEG